MKSRTEQEDWLFRLLKSREARAARILELGRRNAGTVITLTVNWPGPDKGSLKAGLVHRAGFEALSEAFSGSIVYEEIKEHATGDEAYFIVCGPAESVKAQACGIEETHPLGRLFDIDVLGDGLMPISRTALGYKERRCMICGEETIFCRRLNRHTQGALIACIEAMIARWRNAQEGT